MPADLWETSGQSNVEEEEEATSIVLEKGPHCSSWQRSWRAGELDAQVPKTLSLLGGGECG